MMSFVLVEVKSAMGRGRYSFLFSKFKLSKIICNISCGMEVFKIDFAICWI